MSLTSTSFSGSVKQVNKVEVRLDAKYSALCIFLLHKSIDLA